MKKRISGLLFLLFILIVGGTVALAAGKPHEDAPTCQESKNFMDENDDGICDNRGKGNSQGQNFIDEDEDGLCDNRGQGNGCGKGNGKGQGNGCSKNSRNGGCGK